MKRRHVALIYDASLPYDVQVINGIGTYAHQVGNWSVFIEEFALRNQRLPELRTWKGDGILADFDDPKVAAAVRSLPMPVVGFGGGYGWHDPSTRIPYFATDNQAIAKLAADHLLDRGFRRFAFCGFPKSRINGWSEERASAFKQCIREAGFGCSIFTGPHFAAQQWAAMQRALCRWLSSLPKPLGLMACNDKRARHVLEACRTLGAQVPDEVAVVGVDNDVMLCQLADPPLTSVQQGTRRLGYEAAALLDQLMAGKKTPRLKFSIAPEQVVNRRSSDVLAVEDTLVAQLIRFIREHATEGAKVSDVVKAMRRSRTTLETRLQSIIGRTIHDEIRRVQIDQARRLLSTTDLALKQVAASAGFASVQYMTTLFSQQFGQTPAQYRKQSRALPR
ncbi:MAG: DNA-binding transcriptional regulator [Candidatus Omnitrophica bacterium]|nr:DNA-binding transcriptional regulator [Candidatus Omnitrophota bacterium]